MMLNLPEVQIRIKKGLKKLNALRDQRDNIRNQMRSWEIELMNLRERESELYYERAVGGREDEHR